jgi:hypothetical protein
MNEWYNNWAHGWFIDLSDEALHSQGTFQRPYGARIPVGSVVTTIHNSSQHAVEFQVNGTSLGIAFNDIPYEKFYAANNLEISEKFVSFTIMTCCGISLTKAIENLPEIV